VDSILFKPHEEKNVNRKSMFTSIAEILIIFAVLTTLNIYYVYLYADDICYRGIVPLECVARYLSTMVVIQFTNLVRIVQQRYIYINNYLSSCISNSFRISSLSDDNGSGGSVLVGNIATMYILSRYAKRNGAQKFHSLRIILSELNYIVLLINGYYGVSVLALTTWILVTAIVLVLASVEDSFASYVSAGYFIYTFFLLFKMAASCHGAASESDVSKLLVQKLLLDPKLETKCIEELKKFSALLNTTKVEYSACGFFVLGFPFLCSVFGSIFSYIIIMIQLN
jgi:hypothetical protein